MTQWINLGGQERPVCFGYDVAYSFEKGTGGNYNELIFKIVSQMEAVGNAMSEGDLNKVAAAMPVSNITDIVYFGMKRAYRLEGMTVDFEPDDVGGWLFSDQVALQECVLAIVDTLPKPEPGEAKKKPIAAPRSASTGKNLSKQRRSLA